MFSAIKAWWRRQQAISELVNVAELSLENLTEQAVEQLIGLGDRKVLPVMLQILGDESRSPCLRAAACTVVGELGVEQHLAPLSDVLLKRTDWSAAPFELAISNAAATALEKLGWEPQTVEQRIVFAVGMSNFDAVVAEGEAAIESLSCVIKAYETTKRNDDTERARAALEQLLDARNKRLATEAAARAIDGERSMQKLISTFSKWSDAQWRICDPVGELKLQIKEAGFDQDKAWNLLAKLYPSSNARARMLIDNTIASEIVGILRQDRDPATAQKVLIALRGCEKLVEPLNRMFANGDAANRVAAMKALALLGVAQAMEVHEAALNDSEAMVRLAAIDGLKMMQQRIAPEPLLVALERAIADGSDLNEVEGLIALLVQLREPRAVPLLIKRLSNLKSVYPRKIELAALREIGDRSALDPLIDLLSSDHKPEEIVETLFAIDREWCVSPEAEGLVANLLSVPLCQWHSGVLWGGQSSPEYESEKCERSLRILRNFRRTAVLKRLHEGLEHGFPLAAEILGEFGHAGSIRPLVQATADPFIAPVAIKSIAKILQENLDQVETCDLERIAKMSDPRGMFFVRREEVEINEGVFAYDAVYDSIVVSCEHLREQAKKAMDARRPPAGE